jgi:hypothetical protein
MRRLSPLEKRSRQEQRDAANKLNAERRAARLCTWCGVPAAEGSVLCDPHRVFRRDRERKNRQLQKQKDREALAKLRASL